MTKRNKKYNPKKLALYQNSKTMDRIKQVLNDWCMCFMAGDDNCFMWNLDTGRELEAIDPDLADVIIMNRQMWQVHIFALCVDYFGSPYIKAAEITISDSLTHEELLPFLNDAHAALCSKQNQNHFVRPAWLAYAGERVIDIEKEKPRLLQVFEGHGGFIRCDDEVVA